jgi:hypothetical protein
MVAKMHPPGRFCQGTFVRPLALLLKNFGNDGCAQPKLEICWPNLTWGGRAMPRFQSVAALIAAFLVTSCGTYTPDKDPLSGDSPTDDDALTSQGSYEIGIVKHVSCEIGQGLIQGAVLKLPWLDAWGTTVTQSITVEDQSGLNPGVTAITPLQNKLFPFPTGGTVVAPQSFSLSVGVTGSANALRTETIQYTFRNRDIVKYYNAKCANSIRGAMIDGDLKIRQFIYDKAQVAASGNPSLVGSGPDAWKIPPFNTFTEEITFVAAYGGAITPTWKLARLTANTNSNLFVSERTSTNDPVITLGPLKNPKQKTGPIVLIESAMNQHQARVQAAAIAVSISGQSH